ncbi:hypothetical protein VINE108274_12030 [Vibrio neptunius]
MFKYLVSTQVDEYILTVRLNSHLYLLCIMSSNPV